MRRIGRKNSQQAGGYRFDGPASDGQGRARRTLLLGSLTLLIVAGISLAAAGAVAPPAKAPDPPAPTIGTRPVDPSNQTSARFSYSDAQTGVSFQCQLDGAQFSSCPTGGVTYPGPLPQGSHTFKVRALAGAKTSATSSAAWTVDTTAPTTSVSYPSDGLTLAGADWGGRCPPHASICGSAKDAHGVTTVLISIQRSSGGWWSASAFDQQTEPFKPATLASAESDSTRWSYGLPLPADGAYTIHVRAIDVAGNTTPAAAQASSHFTVDTTPPPAPVITARPDATTTAKSAAFTFSDSEKGVRLLCRRDAAQFSACTSPKTYAALSLGSHRFDVEAIDAVGNASAPAGYSWTIAKTVEASGKPFTVTGNASGPLAPGLSRPLAITLSNPNSVRIEVTGLTVAAAPGSTKPGCDGPANLALTQANISASNIVAIPANGQVALPTGTVSAPSVLMRDLSTNQDACKNAAFTFTYSGSAHS